MMCVSFFIVVWTLCQHEFKFQVLMFQRFHGWIVWLDALWLAVNKHAVIHLSSPVRTDKQSIPTQSRPNLSHHMSGHFHKDVNYPCQHFCKSVRSFINALFLKQWLHRPSLRAPLKLWCDVRTSHLSSKPLIFVYYAAVCRVFWFRRAPSSRK